MKVLITGARGFVGQQVAKLFLANGHQVVGTTRSQAPGPGGVQWHYWDPLATLPPPEALAQAQAVVNLMGENIGDGRWTKERKKKIFESRALGTWNLVEGLKKQGESPKAFVSVSAIGFYPVDRGDEEITEQCPPGRGFLSRVCQEWEAQAQKAPWPVVILRSGVVLGQGGGMLRRLAPLFRWGAGGPIGLGRAWMSWIHVQDLAQLCFLAALGKLPPGAYNGASPHPVQNKHFTRALAKSLRRWAIVPVPPLALKLALGEMSCLMLDSQRVVPRALEGLGHEFLYPHVSQALGEIFSRP